jgi:hypothetical protein
MYLYLYIYQYVMYLHIGRVMLLNMCINSMNNLDTIKYKHLYIVRIKTCLTLHDFFFRIISYFLYYSEFFYIFLFKFICAT